MGHAEKNSEEQAFIRADSVDGQSKHRRGGWGVVLVMLFCCLALGIVLKLQSGTPRDAHLPGNEQLTNLRGVAVAVWNYVDGNQRILPPAALADSEGRPLHSWRTLLLPLLDERERFEQVDLAQPWDSSRNKTALRQGCPETYRSFSSPVGNPRYTSIFAVTGEETVFPPDGPISMHDIMHADGLSTTLMFTEAHDLKVEWAEPRDIPFSSLNAAPAELSGRGPSTAASDRGVFVLFCDGHVATLSPDTNPAVLRALATWNGGEAVSPEEF